MGQLLDPSADLCLPMENEPYQRKEPTSVTLARVIRVAGSAVPCQDIVWACYILDLRGPAEGTQAMLIAEKFTHPHQIIMFVDHMSVNLDVSNRRSLST